MSRHADLTLDELLNDPMVRAVMAADRIDAAALEAELRGVARERERKGFAVHVDRTDGRAPSGPDKPVLARSVGIDCCHVLTSPSATHRPFAAPRRDNSCGTPHLW